MAQKRRIVPQLISANQAPPAQSASTALLLPPPPAAGPSPVNQKGEMTLKEQSEYAAKHLGLGRRIYIELTQEKYEINWRKLQKERAVLSVSAPSDIDHAGPEVPKGLPKKTVAPSVFNSVIQKLEQQYMINMDDESDEDEDEAGGEETPNEGAEASDMEGPEAVGGFDDQYDMDDAFIDDSELHDYYGGDRRKAKYTGFFINKGEIEKTGDLVDIERPSPPKKRRKAKADKASEEQPPKEGAEGEAKPKKSKRLREQGAAGEGRKVKKVKKAAKAAGARQQEPGLQAATDAPSAAAAAPATNGNTAGDSAAREEPATHAARPSATQIPQEPAGTTSAAQANLAAADAPAEAVEPAAERSLQDTGHPGTAQPAAPHASKAAADSDGSDGAGQDWSLPKAPPAPAALRKNGGAKGDEVAPSKEVSGAIDVLREAASSAEPPKKDGHRAMPKQVNQVLPGFACAVMREAEEDKAVLKNAVDVVMSFLEPFTTRANLLVRIKNEWERARGGLAAADSALKDEISRRVQVLKQAASMEVNADDDFVTTSPPSSQSDVFLDAHLGESVYSYIIKRLVLEGGSFGPDNGREIFREAAALFPAGTVTEEDLRKVFARKDAGTSRSPRNVQKERSPTGQAPSVAESPAAESGAAAPGQQPVPATRESPPAAAADTTQEDQQQRPQSGAAASNRASSEQKGAESSQDAAGADAALRGSARASADPESGDARRPVSALTDNEYMEWIQDLIQKAVAAGADLKALIEGSGSFKRGTAKSILHLVLMTAGKEGMTIPSMIKASNDLGLTGSSPWEMKESKKSHISSVVNGDPAFAHVGKSQYALAAFEGVVNLPHKRKQKDASASQAPQSSQQPLPAASQASEAAAAADSQLLQQLNGAHSASAPAGQPLPRSEATGSAPAAMPATSNFPTLAAIAEMQRARDFASLPPAILGTLGRSPLLQGLAPEAIAALIGAVGGPSAAQSTTASTAGGSLPAGAAAADGAQGQKAGSQASQPPSSQGSDGAQKYVRPLIGS